MKMIGGLKYLSYEGRLRELWFFSRLHRHLIAAFKTSKRAKRKAREVLFTSTCSARTRVTALGGYKVDLG